MGKRGVAAWRERKGMRVRICATNAWRITTYIGGLSPTTRAYLQESLEGYGEKGELSGLMTMAKNEKVVYPIAGT